MFFFSFSYCFFVQISNGRVLAVSGEGEIERACTDSSTEPPSWLRSGRTVEVCQAALASHPLTAPVQVAEGPQAHTTCNTRSTP